MSERMRMQLVPRPGQPDFLDLPWDEPLEDWESERLAVVERGISRHVVRFVEYSGAFYALKELPHRLAHHEYRLLRELARQGLPAVEGVGIVHRPELEDILITRHLEFSLPYRLMLARRPVADLRARLLDALTDLLVRLHLAGFFWGDCSLSNTLFRRDAGSLAAYVVDVETGELHEQLTDGQREHDLELTQEHFAGELLDLEAELGGDDLGDPFSLADDVRREYERLWHELTLEEEFGAGERSRLHERLRRLNERGFDVEEVELDATESGYRLRVRPQAVEAGHHRSRLLRLTGLDAQENQARRLLQDVYAFKEALERAGTHLVSDAAVAGRWLTDIFEPTIAAIPADLRGKRAPAQVFHELLDHRGRLSDEAGREVGMGDAVESYVENVLRGLPDERAVLVDPGSVADDG
jgi:tRNA A-37 threonylcarbamoyl transferase component Bud32